MTHDFGPALQRFRPALTFAIWYLISSSLLRLVLWFAFGRDAGVGATNLLWFLPVGLLADAVQTLYLLAPFMFFTWLLRDRWYRAGWMRWVLLGCGALFLFFLGFVVAAEYFFFEEFTSRFNIVSVDYLLYPTEVIGDIRAEYPLGAIFSIAGVIAVASVWALRAQVLRGQQVTPRFAARSRVFGVYFAALLLAIAFFDTSLLARSRDRVANELAINGPSSFFRALRTSEIEYHPWYVTRPTRDNVARLEQQLNSGPGTLRRDANGWLVRDVPANPQGLGKLNVVILASESFGAEFSKLYGSERDWTPAFDRLAQGGLWFRQMYASGNRTVRGLEAITSSIPPIPTVSILHRPGSDNIANWGAIMRANGYHTTFFYGGYGSFDDMNRFYASNGFEVIDRLNIPGPTRFENIWGVSDEDLFDTALKHFDGLNSQGKRFFGIVMNTSNHKPFTFREGVPGVKAEGGGRESGVRYADFAKNYFIESARGKPWFDNTLFIIVADHGARVYGRAEIPIGSYRIPMLFYSPRHLKPGVHESLTTQIDIAPTALGLLGIGYSAPFFGQDVLNTPPEKHVAFFSHNHNAALMRDNQMTILGLRKTLKNESYDPVSGEYGPGTVDADRDALTVAYYQTAYEMFRAHQFVTPPQPVPSAH